MIDVMAELKAPGAKFVSSDFRGGLILLHELWDRIPTPQEDTPNAYLILEYGVSFALKLGDLEEAWIWANRAPDFREARTDSGEVEFLIGKVAFESNQMELAEQQFREARRKSEGRVIQRADPKYLALLKKK